VVEVAYNKGIKKIFWPSSNRRSLGPNTPRQNTPQHTVMECLILLYGIQSKRANVWVEYYWKNQRNGLRSLRYPGIKLAIKHKPGGGTTDYAVDIIFSKRKRT